MYIECSIFFLVPISLITLKARRPMINVNWNFEPVAATLFKIFALQKAFRELSSRSAQELNVKSPLILSDYN
jgi:hypothetical protein